MESLIITKTLQAWFTKWGFEYLGNGVHHTAFGGVLDGAKVVVKFRTYNDRCGINFPTDEQLEQFPLLARRVVRPIVRTSHAMITPRAECPKQFDFHARDKRLKRAAEVMSRWFNKIHGMDFDCHAGNIGFIGRKAMIFDPMIENYSNSCPDNS